jgi:hypothetical protein
MRLGYRRARPACVRGRRNRHPRGRAVAGLQTHMRGADSEVRPQAAPDSVGGAPQDHRIDEPVATAVGELSLGEALAQPALAVIRQHHIARQLLAPERLGRMLRCVTLYGTAPIP